MIYERISLPATLHHDIERIAKASQKPVAQVMRDLLDSGVKNWRARTTSKQHGLLRLSSVGIRGPKDLAARLDDYLYGNK